MTNYISISFKPLSGVPQGRFLSLTLYTLFTRDIPDSTNNSTNIMYANDIAQIITHRSKSKRMIGRTIEREVELINSCETKRKIKTNLEKIKIIPLATTDNQHINIEG